MTFREQGRLSNFRRICCALALVLLTLTSWVCGRAEVFRGQWVLMLPYSLLSEVSLYWDLSGDTLTSFTDTTGLTQEQVRQRNKRPVGQTDGLHVLARVHFVVRERNDAETVLELRNGNQILPLLNDPSNAKGLWTSAISHDVEGGALLKLRMENNQLVMVAERVFNDAAMPQFQAKVIKFKAASVLRFRRVEK